MHNDAVSSEAVQLKGLSMTGFETGTRETQSGGGYWLFDPQDQSTSPLTIIKNVIDTAINMGAKIIRIPICGSGWLQNYNVKNWGNQKIATYQDWIDTAVNEATSKGVVVVLDNHLWAIAKETVLVRNQGMEDGCTGINKVCVGVPSCVDSCAPHDWYGQYTSARTGKTYNQGDGDIWECAIANADGCTLDNIKRNNNQEHFYNLWYDLANHYKSNSYVWFELFNEPYQRQSATFNDPACSALEEGAAVTCPPGTGFGDNIDESQYDWTFWSTLMNTTIGIIRGQGANNVIQVSGLDWNYDYLGKGGSSTGGPISRASLMPWATGSTPVPNIAYSLHPYQHGSCCGQIGSTSDQSATDKYESAFCQFATGQPSNSPLPIPSQDPGEHSCNDVGYTTTQNKKAPPCVWVATGYNPKTGSNGVCAGDQDYCAGLDQTTCSSKDWSAATSGGWASYVLPMAKYGPLVATEFGTFDCSSAFVTTFFKFAKQFGVSYTAWAMWPQNSGGPGAGICGYPSVIQPTGGAIDNSCGYGKCSPNCETLSGCAQMIQPLGWAGTAVFADMKS